MTTYVDGVGHNDDKDDDTKNDDYEPGHGWSEHDRTLMMHHRTCMTSLLAKQNAPTKDIMNATEC